MSATGTIIASIIGFAGTMIAGGLQRRATEDINRMSMSFADQERQDQLRRDKIQARLERARLREQRRANRAAEQLRERELGQRALHSDREMFLAQTDRAAGNIANMINGNVGLKNQLLNVWGPRR